MDGDTLRVHVHTDMFPGEDSAMFFGRGDLFFFFQNLRQIFYSIYSVSARYLRNPWKQKQPLHDFSRRLNGPNQKYKLVFPKQLLFHFRVS